MRTGLAELPNRRLIGALIVTGRPPEIAQVLDRLETNGLVLYVCISERCKRARRGPPAMLSESNLGLECPWCREPMAHEWERVKVIVEPSESG